jgi:anti-repressor protein
MKDLILITESNFNGDIIITVNARLLHGRLEVGRDFNTWVKDHITKYEFKEKTDYWVFPKSGENLPKG